MSSSALYSSIFFTSASKFLCFLMKKLESKVSATEIRRDYVMYFIAGFSIKSIN